MKTISFKELYSERLEKPTPAQEFIVEVAQVTKKSIYTVKQWLTGRYSPDKLTRDAIANHFNCDPDSLFPSPKKEAINETI